MGRQKPQYNATSWPDLAQCVPAWEAEKGVRLALHITFRTDLREGAYVEAVAYDAACAPGRVELYRVREPLRVHAASGQVGTLLYAAFRLLNELEANPWYWSTKMRRDAVQ